MLFAMFLPIVIGASVWAYLAGGAAAAAALGGTAYGVKKLRERKHVKGIREAFLESGEAGAKAYAYEHMGVKNEGHWDALWAVARQDLFSGDSDTPAKKRVVVVTDPKPQHPDR